VSVAAHNNRNVTEGGDERMSERASRTASVVPIRPDLAPDSRARTRYHGPHEHAKTTKPSKIRNFVSPHVEEAKQLPELAWLTQQLPETLADIANNLLPAAGEARNPAAWTAKVCARLFKLAVHCTAYAACAATATDKRAAVSAALTILTLAIAVAAHQYGA